MPENCGENPSEVWLDTDAKSVDYSTETIQQDLVFCSLLLEGIDDTIYGVSLETFVDV